MLTYILGVDLAKSMDWTAVTVVKAQTIQGQIHYSLVALDRIKGVEYPVIEDKIIELLEKVKKIPATEGPYVALDASGLGLPVSDHLRKKLKGRSRIYPVVFTGGESFRYDKITHNYNISKSMIIGNFISLQQRGLFSYSPTLPGIKLLEKEIGAYVYHQTSNSNHISMDALPGEHDDLICSLCIPLIISEKVLKPKCVIIPITRGEQIPFILGAMPNMGSGQTSSVNPDVFRDPALSEE